MSPWELGAIYLLLPVLAFMAWLLERTETDGDPVVEFEAWCRGEGPVLAALRCTSGQSGPLVESLRAALGTRREVEHHRGRYPWTRYLFVMAVEHEPTRDVVRLRATSCTLRRLKDARPELGSILDRHTVDWADRLEAYWIHAELNEADDERGAGRRERGWATTIEGGRATPFAPTLGLPAWASQVANAGVGDADARTVT